MATLLELNTFGTESVGYLGVFEKILPGDIKRAFFIYGVPAHHQRAKHGHIESHQALVCLNGSCHIEISNKIGTCDYMLDSPHKCLLVEPSDWILMDQFTSDSVLLVLSNQYYNIEDYFYEKP